MADTAATYDLSLLLDAALPDDERAKVVSEVERTIQGSGTLVGRHDWGVRKLAYEIEHRVDADYHLLQFQGPAELIEALQRSLRISDAVVRFRIIKLPPGAPPVPEVRPDPRVIEAPRPATEATEPAGEVVADETPAAQDAPPAPEPVAEEAAAAPEEATAVLEEPVAEEAEPEPEPEPTEAPAETTPAEAAAAEAPVEDAPAAQDDGSEAEQPAEGAPSSA
jgi:small subunit ribosomal protein S6